MYLDKRLKQGLAFTRCGWPADSGRLPALSATQQSEEGGSTRRQFLGKAPLVVGV